MMCAHSVLRAVVTGICTGVSKPTSPSGIRPMSKRFSGVQRDVLACFRRVLRAAVSKDRGLAQQHAQGEASLAERHALLTSVTALLQTSSSSTSYASKEFRRQAAETKRSDFKKIEYMLRKADKQIKLLSMPGVKFVSGTSQKT